MVFPTVLGPGKRRVEGTAPPLPLRLMDSIPAGETVIVTFELER
jgi:hypothetical protein